MVQSRFLISDEGNSILRFVEGDRQINGFRELKTEMTDGAGEKHLPIVKIDDNVVIVEVGSVFHPMTSEHSIEWVYLITEAGEQLSYLDASGEPIARFAVLPNDKPKYVYAYCNKHGLWKIEL